MIQDFIQKSVVKKNSYEAKVVIGFNDCLKFDLASRSESDFEDTHALNRTFIGSKAGTHQSLNTVGSNGSKDSTTEDNSALIEHITHYYINLLAIYPNNAELNISFAYFILDFTGNLNTVRYQLKQLGKMKLNIEDQLSFYRLRNLVNQSPSQLFGE